MVRRSTWVVLAILVVLIGLTWYLQNREEPVAEAEATPTSIPDLLFDPKDSRIVGILVISAEGKTLSLEDKGVDGWQVIEPELAQADTDQISQFTGSLTSLRALQVLDTPPAADAMQLSTPAYMITVRWSDGRSEVLELGKVTPTGSGYYGRLDDGRIILVPVSGISSLISALDTPPVALETPTPTEEPMGTENPEVATATPTSTP